MPDLGLVVAGDVIYNGVHQYLGESANGGRDAWRKATDTVKALQPRWVVAGHKNKDLDDDAARVIAETRQYLDDADDLLAKNSTARRLLQRHAPALPKSPLGRDHLWAGTSTLYALRDRHDGEVLEESFAGWF